MPGAAGHRRKPSRRMVGKDALSRYLTDEELRELIAVFPDVKFAFAYGSGVVEQDGYARHVAGPEELPMLDLVLGVRNSERWHKINLERNPSHYSGFAQLIGARGVAYVQEELGAKLYYNALVPMPTTSHRGRSMKYGTISMDHLQEDLTDWTWLYIAGRLHKPVRVIVESEQASPLVQRNLASAVNAALLMLPETFSVTQLYTSIAGLSYKGDIRMYFAENPNKVTNMVSASLDRFDELYKPVIKNLPGLTARGYGSSTFEQDVSLSARSMLTEALPAAVRKHLTLSGGGWNKSGAPAPGADRISRAVAAVVSRSSLRQGAKGLITAGAVKSASYFVAKVSSAISGRRERRARSSFTSRRDQPRGFAGDYDKECPPP